MEQFARKRWERFTIRKAWPDHFWQMQKLKGKMEQTAGGNRETPHKEGLELVRHSSDLRFGGVPMRRVFTVGKSGDWETYLGKFLKDGKLSMLASVKVRECYSDVELGDEGRVSIVQDTTRKESHCRMCVLICHCSPLEDHIWWVSSGHGKRQCSLWVCGVRPSVLLEGPEQNLGHTKQHGAPRSKSFSSPRCAARSVRQLRLMRSCSWRTNRRC